MIFRIRKVKTRLKGDFQRFHARSATNSLALYVPSTKTPLGAIRKPLKYLANVSTLQYNRIQNFSFWNSFLRFKGKTGLLAVFQRAGFKINNLSPEGRGMLFSRGG
jgi:hypothetical protein